MNITQRLQKWGNGTGVRLPKKVIEAAQLKLNQTLEISLDGNSIILTPIQEEPAPSLEDLLRGVTPDISGGEMDWSDDTGAERYA